MQERKEAKMKNDNKTMLYDLRIAKRLSLTQVSEQIGINIGTISIYENGKSRPTGDNLKKLANFYQVDAYDLDKSLQKTYVGKNKKRTRVKVKTRTNTKYTPKIETPEPEPFPATTPRTEGLLERVYGKVSMEDFKLIEELINS